MGIRPLVGTIVSFIGEFHDEDPLYLNPGQLALVVYNDIRHQWWYRCPCGSGGILSGHIINSTSPVDISPSIACPSGCHYNIKNGAIV